MSRILIACGGTGGHLAPGIAIAEILEERGHGCRLLISEKEVDSLLIQKYPHLHFQQMPGRAFSGGLRGWLSAGWNLFRGFFVAFRFVRRNPPDAVLLFGGFLSAGIGCVCRLRGIPVALHEANSRPGRAIRLIKRFADLVYLPEGVRLKGLPPKRIRHPGYPVRREIQHCLKAEAWKRLGIEVPNKLLVVLGGSQGAAVLNEWVDWNFDSLAEAGITVYCITGMGKGESRTLRKEGPKGETITATFVPFTNAMGDVITAADLIVSRAGAGSIAEIIRCRAPAILIPYPHATDDHQTANARMHEQHCAGIVLPQNKIDRLEQEVRELIFNDWLLARFKANLARIDCPDAGHRIVRDLEHLSRNAE